MYKVIATIKNKNKIVAYDIIDSLGTINRISKEDIIKAIENKQITNAKIQWYQGKPIIRVSGTDVGKVNVKVEKPNNTSAEFKARAKDISKSISNKTYAESIAEAVQKDNIISGPGAVIKLKELKAGTPLKVRHIYYDEFEQVIYLGITEVQGHKVFGFFNGQGIDGWFAYSSNFICEKTKDIQFKLYDNDPEEVTFLLNYIKKGPFNLSNIL